MQGPGGKRSEHPHPPLALQQGTKYGTQAGHDEATHDVAMHAPLLQTLPAPAQSVHVLPPVPHAALAFAMTHPASPAQQVLQLLGPQAMAPPLLPVPRLLPLLLAPPPPELLPLPVAPLLLAPLPLPLVLLLLATTWSSSSDASSAPPSFAEGTDASGSADR